MLFSLYVKIVWFFIGFFLAIHYLPIKKFSYGSLTSLGKKTILLLIIANFIFMCVGPCPIILIMPQVFNICTTVLGSTTKGSSHCPSLLLHASNSIEKTFKIMFRPCK